MDLGEDRATDILAFNRKSGCKFVMLRRNVPKMTGSTLFIDHRQGTWLVKLEEFWRIYAHQLVEGCHGETN